MIAVMLSLSFSLSTVAVLEPRSQEPIQLPELPGLPLAPGPIIEFKGAYPFDTQSVLEVTPDNSRAFVAEGAAISILDLNSLSGTTPAVIDRVALPGASPLALQYYELPVSGQKHLFIAGGTMGLWRMSFCSQMMVPPPGIPSKCACPVDGCDPYSRTRIDIVEDQDSFQRKRCVAMAIVEGNQAAENVPILCVLYSARASIPMPFGPTEMRAYLLNLNGTVVPYGDPLYFGPSLTSDTKAVGNSIVADPGDPNAVYVSLGTSWLYKVSLATMPFSASRCGPNPFACPFTPCPGGELT